MGKLHFMGRKTFEIFSPDEPSVYISIASPWDKPAQAAAARGWLAGLVWFREDNDDSVTERESKMLVDFIDTWRDCSFVVHCGAGISRSAAVACYIGALLDREPVGLDANTMHANAVIKAALLRHLWIDVCLCGHSKEMHITKDLRCPTQSASTDRRYQRR